MPDHPTKSEILLLDGNFYIDRPLHHYAWMRANAPLYYDEVGDIWGVTLHEDIMTVSKSPETFCSGTLKHRTPTPESVITAGYIRTTRPDWMPLRTSPRCEAGANAYLPASNRLHTTNTAPGSLASVELRRGRRREQLAEPRQSEN